MATIFTNTTILTPTETLSSAALVAGEDGRITYVGPVRDLPRVEGPRINLNGRTLIPGLIDVHVHGGNGVNMGVAGVSPKEFNDELNGYSDWVARGGVTGFLAGILMPDRESMTNLVADYADLFDKGLSGAEGLGVFLEGPFMNVEQKGAIKPPYLRDPDMDEAQGYLDAARGWMRQIAMAPELTGAEEVASLFRKAGVVVAFGHSDTDYEGTRRALEGNWTHITHTFNKHRGLHHREPGAVGAILTSEEITTELIADSMHVHPAVMKLLVRSVGVDRVVLITDATALAGLPDGDYEVMGLTIYVRNGLAKIPEGNIAGSTVTLNRCVRNMVHDVSVSLADAVQMATLNPARAMGFSNRLGSLEVGKDASLAVIDEDVNVYLTMVQGRIVFNEL
ncbi:MAG: N-acetylglucosamine-6-phosphate deacetylase [Anaerolineales bacterium]|nr:N-acetylglucosamine-6-phosphate deacetylase [Anaerolineales bacterium]